jgi:hypothetical protein
MPQIKLLIDNQVVYESTDPTSTSIKSILKKNRVTMEENITPVAMEDLTQVTSPIDGQNYYYISPTDRNIYEGVLARASVSPISNSKTYVINSENGKKEMANKVYVKKQNIGGKRRTKRSKKRSRKSRRKKR